MSDPVDNPNEGERARQKAAGLFTGIGATGFLARSLVEITAWFGTAAQYPRPERGLVYPVAAHGIYFVSAGEVILHAGIFVYWLIFVIGVLFRSIKPDSKLDYANLPFEPNKVYGSWLRIGAVAMIFYILAIHLLAHVFVASGWDPNDWADRAH